METTVLDRDRIIELLTELGRRLDQRGLHASLYVVGGTAMALAYNRDRTTKDIDAIFEPKTAVYAEARRMAEDLGLPDGWVNDGVKGLLPDRSDPDVQTALTAPGISVGVASGEYLFAMKAAAARIEEDTDDLRLLARTLGLTSADQALDLLERFYDRARLAPRSQFVVQELFEQMASETEVAGR
jgi:hypothetical protein